MRRKYLWPVIIICSVVLISLALTRTSRLWGQNVDVESLSDVFSGPFIFRLELVGAPGTDYTECLGLGSSNDVEENTIVTMTYTGSYVTVRQKTPGVLQWHNITLKRTSLSEGQVWSWRKAMEDGNLNQAIRDGAIIMHRSGSPEPLAQWNFRNGWAASLSFDGSVEELTIVHDGLELVIPGSEPVPSRR